MRNTPRPTRALASPPCAIATPNCPASAASSSFAARAARSTRPASAIDAWPASSRPARTYPAAARALCLVPKAGGAAEAKRNVNTCVKAVAGLLGNTAAVCRGSYIHPLVLEAYQQGVLPLKPGGSERAFELAVIRFLEAAKASYAQA